MTPPRIERTNDSGGDGDLAIRVGREELVIRHRYQTVSILNDFLIGLWFLLGSIAFFWPAWQETGTWLFVLGSAQLLIRPLIRLVHQLHLQPIPPGRWEL